MVGPITARDTGPVRKHIAINKISETVGGGGRGAEAVMVEKRREGKQKK